MSYEVRERIAKLIWHKLSGNDSELYKKLSGTRNAYVHGARLDKAEIRRILTSREKFGQFVNKVLEVFDRSGIPGSVVRWQ
jgi:uncharacterized protein YutE (UPF0331/DUF86 family)